MTSRRAFLTTVGASTVALGGCSGVTNRIFGGGGGVRVVEDFEDGLDAYEENTEGFETTDDEAFHGEQSLSHESSVPGTPEMYAADFEGAPEAGDRFRVNVKIEDDNQGQGADLRVAFAVESLEEKYGVFVGTRDEPFLRLKQDGNTLDEAEIEDVVGDWLEVEVDWRSEGDSTAILYEPDARDDPLAEVEADLTDYESGGIGWRLTDSFEVNRYFDYLRVLE